jgi:hypothetical protein
MTALVEAPPPDPASGPGHPLEDLGQPLEARELGVDACLAPDVFPPCGGSRRTESDSPSATRIAAPDALSQPMGKIDDMRRQREAQHAEQERASQERAAGAPAARAPVPAPATAAPADVETAAAAPAPVPTPRIALPTSRTPRGADEQGKCTGCGKLRPLVNGLVASHQKGLGKMCTGSRKEPA